MSQDIRWKQRFENFERAFVLLRDALDRDINTFSDLEKEGVIQRFEFTFELAWKTLKDFLVFSGVAFDQITPREVIKQAFAANILTEGQLWIDMLDLRNLMSHTYDENLFADAVRQIQARYLKALNGVYLFLKGKS